MLYCVYFGNYSDLAQGDSDLTQLSILSVILSNFVQLGVILSLCLLNLSNYHLNTLSLLTLYSEGILSPLRHLHALTEIRTEENQ